MYLSYNKCFFMDCFFVKSMIFLCLFTSFSDQPTVHFQQMNLAASQPRT